jgi:hypothetical protein
MNLAPSNPPLTPRRRGTRQSVLLPSWEGLGVGSGALCGRKIMKIKQLLVALAALCASATVVGCASTGCQVSQSSFDVMNLNLNPLAFQKPDLDTNGAVTLDEWQRFHTSAEARENFSALDESGDGQINWSEFLKQATNHSKRYPFFADTDKTNDGYVSWEKELFQQPGWQLFSIRF